MARPYQELLTDLFRSAASVAFDKLKAEVDRRTESFHARGIEQSSIRAEITTQLVIDAYENVLHDVQSQLEIPAESIGIRTKNNAEDFLLRNSLQDLT